MFPLGVLYMLPRERESGKRKVESKGKRKKRVEEESHSRERIRVIDLVESATPADDSYPVSWTEGFPFPTADPLWN